MARPRRVRRQWWFSRRARLFWVTFAGCVNFNRHLTWREVV